MYSPVKQTYPLSLVTATSSKSKGAMLAMTTLLASLIFAFLLAWFGADSFLAVMTCMLALPVAYIIVAYPKAGICILLVLAYIIMFFTRLTSVFPLGTMMDAVEILLIFGFLLKKKQDQGWAMFRNGISYMILAWIAYNLIEIANPTAESRLAWVYTVRPIAIVATTYFIFLYHIRDIKFIRLLLKIWIALSFLAAAYTYKQEFFGFSRFELTWLKSDPAYYSLYYIGNHWRKFSIFSDPVAQAYNMAASCILCWSMMTGPVTILKRLSLFLLGAFFFVAMLYSGTRGAFILVPACFLLFVLLKFNRRMILAGLVVGILAVGAIFMPTSNPTLYRFQTAFKPANDASFNIRKYNQKRIQPYILSHPLGGGLGATGIWGKRFSPGSYLANFPPDSGYVRVAVELGWIGLFLFCTFMFVILKNGIHNYFRIKNPELKAYCLAMLLIVFALNLGNYPQEALVQYPINIYFYLAVALIPITLRLDQAPAPETLKATTHGT